MSFGDARVDAMAETDYFASVAAATRNGLLQWFYLNTPRTAEGEQADLPLWLLGFDASLKPQSPTGRFRQGRGSPLVATRPARAAVAPWLVSPVSSDHCAAAKRVLKSFSARSTARSTSCFCSLGCFLS